VFLEPEILFFEGDMFINHTYTQSVKLRKDYEGIVHYKLRMEGKTSESLNLELKTQGYTITSAGTDLGTLIDSKISSDKEIEIQLTISCSECGDQSAFFYIEVQDGAPISFQCKASFKGPTLKIIEPVVDFGLMKINTSSKFRINIENTSPIPSEVLIRSFSQPCIDFSNFTKHIDKIRYTQSSEGNAIRIDRPTAVIAPFSRCEFLLTLDCIRQETLEEYFEIIVKDGDTNLFF